MVNKIIRFNDQITLLTAGKSGATVDAINILVLLTAPQDLQLKETKNE